ncbi:MAG: transporter substrate-binding domain-containing protein [Coriobacteriia bacterium]|nr:transporter substrate-binding domain-containing protein [Coriobacteriia bacterium]
MPRRTNKTIFKTRLQTGLIMMLALLLMLPLGGCIGQKPAAAAKLTPKIKPPAIHEAGKLYIGANLGLAPFAAKTTDGYEGFDIELGRTLAKHLGLEPVFVATTPDTMVAALNDNKIDIALSVSPDVSGLVMAQSYYQDAQALFAHSGETSRVAATPLLPKTALQEGSTADKVLASSMSSTDASATVQPYPTLSAAIQAVEKSQAVAVAGDYIVLRFAQQNGAKIEFVRPLDTSSEDRGVGIRADNLELMRVMKPLMVELNQSGALASIMRTWIGDNQLTTADDF